MFTKVFFHASNLKSIFCKLRQLSSLPLFPAMRQKKTETIKSTMDDTGMFGYITSEFSDALNYASDWL